jgi:hypothetical protein
LCAHDKSNSPTNCASDQPDSPKSVHGKMLGWQTRGVLLPAGIALCVYVCVWTCMRVCVGVCAYVYVCVYICIQLSPLALFAIQKLEVVNWRTRGSALWTVCRVGQNHICTVYIRCFWQGNHQLYGHIRGIYTVLVNSNHLLPLKHKLPLVWSTNRKLAWWCTKMMKVWNLLVGVHTTIH